MTKAYSYARWSSAAQGGDDHDSERRQIENAKAYAAKHGLELDTSHIDRGMSAYKSHHRKGHLGRFLASVRAGEIAQGSVLIIESVDRLSREPVLDALELFTELTRVCTIVTLFDGMTYNRESMNNNFEKLFTVIIKMSVAHEESVKKSKRKTESWIAKRQDAYASNKLMSRNCPAWIKVVDGKPVEEPKRAEIVRQIFADLCHAGKAVIAKNLNAAGVESFKGKSWHASMIQKLVDDRRVLGEYQPHQLVKNPDDTMKRVPLGEPIPNYYPQIVDPALYHRAKVAVASRRTSGASRANKATFSNLFAGLAECGQCHQPMVYRNKGDGPKGGVYLVCGAAARRYNCDNKKHY
jgi:DNA invertase Pin-like site-specific DNA recombinase